MRKKRRLTILFIIVSVSIFYAQVPVTRNQSGGAGKIFCMHLEIDTVAPKDFSGNGLNGAVTGAVFNATGAFTGCYYFDGGANDYIQVGDNALLSPTSGFTIGCWYRTTGSTNFGAMVSKYGTGNREWYLFNYQSSDLAGLYVYDESANAFIARRVTSAGLTDGIWHYVVATWNGGTSATDIEIYIDGVNRSNNTDTTGTFVGLEDKAAPMLIGTLDKTATWTGEEYICDVFIDDDVYTAAEVKQHYYRGFSFD